MPDEKVVGTDLINKSGAIGIHMVPNIGTAPNYDYKDDYEHRIVPQGVASCYFYTDYDPKEHFEYNIAFNDDNTINQEQTLDNQKKAFAKAIEHHFSFEQVLPEENNCYIEFYRPRYDGNVPQTGTMRPMDYYDIAEKDYVNVTEEQLLDKVSRLPIKSMLVGQIGVDMELDEDYSKMDIVALEELYKKFEFIDDPEIVEPIYRDATRWNVHCYECATYCRIERPIKVVYYNKNEGTIIDPEWGCKILQAVDSQGNGEWQINDGQHEIIHYVDKNGNPIQRNGQVPKIAYVSAYEFRKQIRLVNSVLNTKIPVEEGWYRFDKLTKKWEFICDINRTIKLNYDFEYVN